MAKQVVRREFQIKKDDLLANAQVGVLDNIAYVARQFRIAFDLDDF